MQQQDTLWQYVNDFFVDLFANYGTAIVASIAVLVLGVYCLARFLATKGVDLFVEEPEPSQPIFPTLAERFDMSYLASDPEAGRLFSPKL